MASSQDKAFYQAMGKRLAQFRKAQNMTQTQLAEALGISQQTMAHYEGGSCGLPLRYCLNWLYCWPSPLRKSW